MSLGEKEGTWSLQRAISAVPSSVCLVPEDQNICGNLHTGFVLLLFLPLICLPCRVSRVWKSRSHKCSCNTTLLHNFCNEILYWGNRCASKIYLLQHVCLFGLFQILSPLAKTASKICISGMSKGSAQFTQNFKAKYGGVLTFLKYWIYAQL